MAKRILSIVETAYRATLEEQDDTVLWLTQAMRAAGAELSIVLRGNAVCYVGRGHDAAGLAFGDRRQTNPPRLDEDVAGLVAKGIPVMVVEEDLAVRGLAEGALVKGVERIPCEKLGELIRSHDLVWHW